MSEYRITRVDTGSLTAVECTYPSLEAAEDFLRHNWQGRHDQWEIRRIVEWLEEDPIPIASWKIDPESGDLVLTNLAREFYDYGQPT